MKISLPPFNVLGLTAILLGLGVMPLTAIAQSSPPSDITAQRSSVVAGRLRFRLGTIRPTENRTPGITRGNCNALAVSDSPTQQLVAMVPPLAESALPVTLLSQTEPPRIPLQIPVETTTQEKPDLFVYIPATPAETAAILVTNQDGSETLFEGTFAVPSEPSIVRLAFPEEAPSMEPGERYIWSVSLHCDPITRDRSADPLVEGWITRVLPDADLVADLSQTDMRDRPFLYAQAGIWQDTLTAMADLRLQYPEDAEVVQNWESLLASAHLSAFIEAPLQSVEVVPTPGFAWEL